MPAVYAALKAVVAKVAGEATVNQLEAKLKEAGQPAGFSAYDLIQSFKGKSVTILRLDPERPGLQHHIDILRHQDRRWRKRLLHEEGTGNNPVILLGKIRNDRPKPPHGRRSLIVLNQITVDDDRKSAAIGELDPFEHRS